ncbi:MAG: glutathione-disulfide reductase, partial [Synechococcales bacterium]|nr:glutathione-disulfide reductase [Synechococcales bacterium]
FVIGAGSGGIAAARRAASYGAKVGIVERDRLGGTCVNRGCVPKKLMVYASQFPKHFKAAAGYGWQLGERSLDWTTMVTGVNNELARLNGIYQRMLNNSSVEILEGYGRFVNDRTVEIGDRKVTAERILIAVGGEPILPKIAGSEYLLSSDQMFSLPEQPKRAAVIGGGYIGCEFACILNGLGTEVYQILRGDRILRGFDDDIRNEVQAAMQNHGIQILTDTQVEGIERSEDGATTIKLGNAEVPSITVDAVTLAAIGRRPLTDKLGLENAGVETISGYISVNEYSQTSVEHIYAVGDCTNNVQLTPVAISEGRALADTLFGGQDRKISYDNIPTAVFTSPEVSTVGLTEAEARERYGDDAIKVYRSRFRAMYYTIPDMDVKTLMKLIVHNETGKVLGAHMVGDYAAEIIQGVAIAVKMGATKADFDATIAIHPSSAEEFVTMR